VRTALLVVAILAFAAAPAAAENGYDAKLIAQSPNLTLESGEVGDSYFDAQNVGSNVWTNDVVRLGTQAPQDRHSAFWNESWLGAGRPTPLEQPSVPLGGIGRFAFTVTAPNVATTTVYDEHFAPLAEGLGWMEGPNWPDDAVFIEYTVIPGAPPTVRLSPAPGHVAAGQPVNVHAEAADNRQVVRVEFRLAGRAPVVDTSAPYDASLDSSGLRSGGQPVTATAVDETGRSTTATATVTLDPVANGAGASNGARLTAGFGKRHPRPRVTIPYGAATYVRGRLTDENGRPITGAVIRVASRVLTGMSGFRSLPPVSTGRDGGFAYRAPRGPSRQLLLTYTAFNDEPQPTAVRLVRLKTRAGVRMRADRRSVRPGGVVHFHGRLQGGHSPRRGVLVVLEGLQRGFGWRTFKTVRARHGRFHSSYRFVRAAPGATIRFRATVREQATYPWATGRSRSVAVRIR
jgi:hypothetical protein